MKESCNKESYNFETAVNGTSEILPEKVAKETLPETELTAEVDPVLDLVPRSEFFEGYTSAPYQNQGGISESSLERSQKSFVDSCRQSFDKLTQVAAMIAMFSGSLGEASGKESRLKEDEKSTSSNSHKSKTEQVQREKENSEYRENLERVNSICQKHGLNIIDFDPAVVNLYIPDEEIEKVIVHVGQSHNITPYEKTARGERSEIIKSQKEIYKLFDSMYRKTGKAEICLMEGLCNEEEIEEILNNKKTYIDYYEHFLTMATDSNIDIDVSMNSELKHIDKYIRDHRHTKSVKDFILFDMSRAARKALEVYSDDESNIIKVRLLHIIEKIERKIDFDVLAYSVGGVTLAAKLEHAILMPAENFKESHKAMNLACKELNIVIPPGENFYEYLQKLPKEVSRQAHILVEKYALSAEREKYVIDFAQIALEKTDIVFTAYGALHDFKDVLGARRKNGEMKGVALIKIKTVDFEKVISKEKK